MKLFLKDFFKKNWQRKLASLGLAMVIWFTVNHSLTSTRTIGNVSVRVRNVPAGKTIEGLQNNGCLLKKLTLTLVGNASLLEELTPDDIEIVIDASNRPDEWVASISKRNLVCLNPEIDLSSAISRVYHPNFLLRMRKLVKEKIAVVVTPIGEAPRGYQLLDVWPCHLTATIRGPEEVVEKLKMKEQKLTFNLNNISKSQLDSLALAEPNEKADIISFLVPNEWKRLHIPLLSNAPIEVDDPKAKTLRINFVRSTLSPARFPSSPPAFSLKPSAYPPFDLSQLSQ